MLVREQIEAFEREHLSPAATLACNSLGRERPEEEDDLRTCFMRDRDRIVHCKAFRRLKHKTQVFLSPEGDHYRTRLTHTLEVAQIARTIARSMNLNEDLTEAIALGHDLGHTPFGHAGERALRAASGRSFDHNEQSLRIVRRLEKDGRGLNLTREVMDGILCHTGPKEADTLEGQIVRISDRIAYINHDIDDAIRAGVLSAEQIPLELRQQLGERNSQRIGTLVSGAAAYGRETGRVGLPSGLAETMDSLRDFMFQAVYLNPVAKGEEGKGMEVVQALYRYFEEHPEEMPTEYLQIAFQDDVPTAVCDYIAGMTDRYAITKYQDIFIPKAWNTY
ncbi:MAG: deoxyguanosinetriphosphate triphosphohydrolase [Clostridia bacterium]|nr:deoxyguanosinetriphosphate triphosphohydrolase [Clostridia bacterium]